MRGEFNRSMRDLIFVSSLVLGLAGCAQPKYETVAEQPGAANPGAGDAAGNGGGAPSKETADCAIRLNPSGACLSWKWEAEPTRAKAGSLIFKVFHSNAYDATPVEQDLAHPAVVLWMPSMGHGSSPTQVDRLDTGTYRASNVYFVMPGQWEIRFQDKDGADVRDEAVVALTVN